MRYQLLVSLLLLGLLSVSQSLPQHNIVNVLPPSPTAAELGRVGLVSDHLSTGEINTQIPLYTYKTPNLQIPLTLNYSANGLKVNQVATRVGLGWSFNVGGVITRTILGKPDDISPRLPVPADFPSTAGITGTNFIDNAVSGGFDFQPDLFTFNFSGGSGRFFINVNNEIVKLEQNNLMIINNNYGSFTIQTPDGVIYTFADVEKSSYTNNCSGVYFNHATPVTNAWFLTSIVHPDGDQVWIKYGSCNFNYQSSKEQSFNGFDFFNSYQPLLNGNCNQPSAFSECDYYTHNYGVYPIQIGSNAKGVVKFEYTERNDIPGDMRLASMEVINTVVDSHTILGAVDPALITKTFEFDYSDVPGNTLFLTHIYEIGASTDLPGKNYDFKYNNLELVPQRLSYSQDYLGYYNGKSNRTLILKPEERQWRNLFQSYGFGNRTPDWNYSKIGMLSKITYPTKGYDSVVYEANTIHDENYNAETNTTLTYNEEGGTQSHQYITKYSPFITINQNNIAELNIYCKLNSSLPQSATINTPDYYLIVDVEREGGGSVLPQGSIRVNLYDQLVMDVPLMQGNAYRLKIVYASQVADLGTLEYYDGPKITERQLPGVRVQKILSVDNAGNAYPKKYYYANLSNLNSSSGVTNNYYPNNKITYNNRIPAPDPDGNEPCRYKICTYVRFGSDCFYDMQPSVPVLYPVVLESNGEDFTNGVTEHKFFTTFDATAQLVSGSPIMNAPNGTSGSLGYNGFEYQTNFYKQTAGGLIIQKAINKTLNTDESLRNDYNFFTLVATGSNLGCHFTDATTALQNYVNLSCLEYQFLSRWIYPDHITTTDYDENGVASATTVEDDEYGNNVHKQLTRQKFTYNSGNIVTKQYKYLQDILGGDPTFYNQVGATAEDWNGWNNLSSNYIFNQPLHSLTYRNNNLLEESVDFYRINPANNIAHRNTVYSHLSSFPFEKKIEIPLYNNWGQILTQKKAKDVEHNYIWGYNGLYPVAHIINAPYSSVIAILNPDILQNPPSDDALRTELNKIRQQFPSALVTTYTYKPLTGLSSETDVNGKTTYYEYDALDRLKLIRDKDNNIIKKFCYNYAGQPENCN